MDSINHKMSDKRRALVTKARDGWIKRLVDLSRRNSLLYYRDLKRGTLDLSIMEPEVFEKFLKGDAVPLEHLLPDVEDQVFASLNNIRRKALSNQEEKGLETLYLTIGMATWKSNDGGRPPEAPIFMYLRV